MDTETFTQREINQAVTGGRGYLPRSSYDIRCAKRQELKQYGQSDEYIDLAVQILSGQVSSIEQALYLAQTPEDRSDLEKDFFWTHTAVSILGRVADQVGSPSARRAIVQNPEDVYKLVDTYSAEPVRAIKKQEKIFDKEDADSLLSCLENAIKPEETGFAMV